MIRAFPREQARTPLLNALSAAWRGYWPRRLAIRRTPNPTGLHTIGTFDNDRCYNDRSGIVDQQ